MIPLSNRQKCIRSSRTSVLAFGGSSSSPEERPCGGVGYQC